LPLKRSDRWTPHGLHRFLRLPAPVLYQLLGIQLDYKLFVDVLTDLIAARQRDYSTAKLVGRNDFQPARPAAPRGGLKRTLDVNVWAARFSYRDFVAHLDLKAGNVYLASVHCNVTVCDELTSLSPRCSVTQPINHIVQAPLEQREQVLAGDTLHPNGSLKVQPELSFEHAVDSFYLLLFPELLAVPDELCPPNVSAMLTGWLGAALLDGTTRLVTPLALQEQFHSFPAAKPAHRSSISCQLRLPPSTTRCIAASSSAKVYRRRNNPTPFIL